MANIYSKSGRLIFWLGKDEVDTKDALYDICVAVNGMV